MFFLLVLVVIFYFYIDCDFITLLYHYYRCRFKPDCYYGRTLWIVGASSGMGEHLVYESVKNLASCIIISARRKNELERVLNNCEKIDSQCKIIIKPLDLFEFAKNSKLCHNYIENEIFNDPNIKECDIIVINSGITQRGLGINTDLSVMNKLININILGVISLIQGFVHTLRDRNLHIKLKNNKSITYKSARNRSIFVTSSLGGKIGSPGQSVYCMTKHGINGYLEGIRAELYNDNIHIGIVCPGPIELTESSLGGIGMNLESESGRLDSKNETKRGKKMSVKRCAKLYTTAISCNLTESWISKNPQLLFVYLKQYLPAFLGPLYKIVGPRYMKKLMDSQNQQKKESVKKDE